MMGSASRAQAAALAGLALLCAGLAGVVYRELADPLAERSDAPAAPAAAGVSPLPSADAAFALPPISSYAEIVERPLLSPNRRPAQTAGQDTPFTVTGIIVSPGMRSAVVTHGTPPIMSRVVEGQEIDGWTVQSIRSDHIILARGTAQAELKLVDKSTAAPAPNVGKAGAPPLRK
jgi:hypothetical protein